MFILYAVSHFHYYLTLSAIKLTYCTFHVFNIRYPEMQKVQDAKCAISKLMYGSCVCMDDNHSLKFVAYRLVHTDEPYINLHMAHATRSFGLFEITMGFL